MGQIKLSKFAALQFCSHCYPDAVSVVLPDMYLSMDQNQSITCYYHSDKTDVQLSRHDDLGFARRPYFLSFESACGLSNFKMCSISLKFRLVMQWIKGTFLLDICPHVAHYVKYTFSML